jgi:hypothetical protein
MQLMIQKKEIKNDKLFEIVRAAQTSRKDDNDRNETYKTNSNRTGK